MNHTPEWFREVSRPHRLRLCDVARRLAHNCSLAASRARVKAEKDPAFKEDRKLPGRALWRATGKTLTHEIAR